MYKNAEEINKTIKELRITLSLIELNEHLNFP